MSISWNIEKHKTIQSTQDIVKGMARIGQTEGMVVQAGEQTGGRGRHGREWISEKGNLYLSVLLSPSCPARNVGQVAILSGLAVADTVRAFIKNPETVHLKWPNDVLIDGEKCAGMLLETEISGQAVKWVYLGLGLNVEHAPPGLGTALADHAKKAPQVDKVRDVFLKNLEKYYLEWVREGFANIRQAWLASAHKKGEAMKIRIAAQIETGVFHGIDESGNLLLHDRDLRLKTVTAGEVFV